MQDGRSGDHIVRTKNTFIKTGSVRLIKQATKQQKFVSTSTIITPKIDIISDSQVCMHLIHGHNLLEVLTIASIRQLQIYAERLLEIIDRELDNSRLDMFDHSKFQSKLDSLAVSEKMTLPLIEIPVGDCHGDLTITNCMIDVDGRLVILDFLDTFYETPLQDIASLLQETWAEWCLLVGNIPPISHCRIRVWLRYLQNLIFDRYSTRAWWPAVEFFARIKLLRIIPYLKQEHEINWIKQILTTPFPRRDLIPAMAKSTQRNFLISVGGKSTRFPNMKPKWLLTHPDGRLVISASLDGMPLASFDRKIILVQREHLRLFLDEAKLRDLLPGFELFILDPPTYDLIDDLQHCIIDMKVEGFLFIKDCDNSFELSEIPSIPGIAISDNVTNMDGKGRVECDIFNMVSNILEKRPYGKYVSIGGYAFEEARKLLSFPIQFKTVRYSSDLIFWELLDGIKYQAMFGLNYQDWGVASVWFDYVKKHSTYFVDLDGTLFANRGKYTTPDWSEEPIPLVDNIAIINQYKKHGGMVIITTSRPKSYRDLTIRQLDTAGISYDELLMGLPHSPRVLINDFATSNPYPTAIAVNVPRDGKLADVIP